LRVLLFAALRELAGSGTVESSASDVGALLDDLARRFGPNFARIVQAGTVIVDGETAPRDRALTGLEEVAVLPPVSGG
jgi:molybdopterin converting factor small subunit